MRKRLLWVGQGVQNIKVGDTGSKLELCAVYGDGRDTKPADFEGFTQFTLNIRSTGDSVKQIVPVIRGNIAEFSSRQLEGLEAGRYYIELVAKSANNTVSMIFPDKGGAILEIDQNLEIWTAAGEAMITVRDARALAARQMGLLTVDKLKDDAEFMAALKGTPGAKGDTGEQGPEGPAGQSATVSVGTVTGGHQAQVTNSGTSTDAVLNFVLPKGDKGDAGEQGPAGQDGQPGAKGDKGDPGQPGVNGQDGQAATVSVGTVTSGEQAQVTNSGTSTDAVLNFVLPKGDKGDTGEQGPQGQPGPAGQDGAKGDKGDPGQPGVNGQDGQAATVNVGTVTSGEQAQVTNSGTSTDAVLNFVLPKGDKGDAGEQGPQGQPGPAGQDGAKGDKGDAGINGIGLNLVDSTPIDWVTQSGNGFQRQGFSPVKVNPGDVVTFSAEYKDFDRGQDNATYWLEIWKSNDAGVIDFNTIINYAQTTSVDGVLTVSVVVPAGVSYIVPDLGFHSGSQRGASVKYRRLMASRGPIVGPWTLSAQDINKLNNIKPAQLQPVLLLPGSSYGIESPLSNRRLPGVYNFSKVPDVIDFDQKKRRALAVGDVYVNSSMEYTDERARQYKVIKIENKSDITFGNYVQVTAYYIGELEPLHPTNTINVSVAPSYPGGSPNISNSTVDISYVKDSMSGLVYVESSNPYDYVFIDLPADVVNSLYIPSGTPLNHSGTLLGRMLLPGDVVDLKNTYDSTHYHATISDIRINSMGLYIGVTMSFSKIESY